MKKIFKRLAAVATAAAVTVTTAAFDLPKGILALFAAETTAETQDCDGYHKGWHEITGLDDDVFTNYSSRYCLKSGKYYLGGDLTLNQSIGIQSIGIDVNVEKNVEVTLCLNGHTIDGNEHLIIRVNNGTLTLCDCSAGKTGKLTNGNGAIDLYGTLNMYGGNISGNNKAGTGGGVDMSGGGDFNMYGGTISNNTARSGGGVCVWSGNNFNMYGGTISDNKAIKDESGVGGNGGGVYAYGKPKMSGDAVISGNTAENGGGVYLGVYSYNDGSGVFRSGTLDMNDNAQISGNTAKDGGGVYVDTFTTTGGKIYNGTLTMNDGTVSGNTATQNGGGVYNAGTFNMKGGNIGGDVTVNGEPKAGNEASVGGGVYVDGSNAKFTMSGGSTISGNTASGIGGGVYVFNSGTFEMGGDSTISGNKTDGGGGGVYNAGTFNMKGGNIGGEVTVNGETKTGNEASSGGGVYVNGSNAKFTMSGGSAISGNTASYDGGGVFVFNSGTFEMGGDSTISGNKADSAGGVFVSIGTFEMTGGTIGGTGEGESNTASNGGGVYVTYKFKMSGGTISGNKASGNGGGVYMTGSNATFTMSGGTIGGTDEGERNTANNGGGVYVNNSSKFEMRDNGTISGNTASSYGGGVYLSDSGSEFTMSGGTISGNNATNGGGVRVSNSSKFEMSGGTISDNKSSSGGGVRVYSGTFTINGNVEISGNTKTDGISADNVSLYTNKTITIGNGFDTFSKIGVNTSDTLTDCTNFVNAAAFAEDAAAKDISASFTADTDGQSIFYADDKVQLKGAHTWGEWEITEKPTTETTGTAERSCTIESEHTETEELPKLTDTEVWTKTTKPATCTEDGSDVYESEYGTVTVTIKATNHKNAKQTEAVAATCIKEGNIEYWYCPDCDKYFSDEACTTEITEDETVIEANGHTLTKVDEVPATEEEDGTKEHWHCSVCGKNFSDSEGESELDNVIIPALGHVCGDNAAWSYDEETKTLIITGTGDMYNWTDENPAPWAEFADEIVNVIIDDGITSIGDNAFKDCTSLEEVEFKGETPPTMGDGVFDGCDSLEQITVPEGSEDAYKEAEGFDGVADSITDGTPDNTGSCGDNLTWTYDPETKTLTITGTGDMTDWADGSEAPWAEYADEIEKVVIEEGVTSIGDNAFEGCTALTEVEIPDTVTEIGDSAFEGCTALTEVEIPENVEAIGENAFKDCTELEAVTFKGEEPPALGEGAFEGCDDLKNIYVPKDSLTDYADSLEDFVDNTAILPDTSGGETDYSGSCGESLTWTYDPETKTLIISGEGDMDDWGDGSEAPWAEFADEIEKVVIEEGVTSVGDNAFEGCTALTEAEIPDTVTEIGDSAFEGCTALESVEIPEGVEIIGDSAFEGCESLTEVVIPESVTEIGDGAFAGCTELETVTFEGEEPPTIGEGVFEDCGSLENIYVPKDSVDDYANSDGLGDVAGSISAEGYSGECGENLTWTYDPETKTLIISGTGDMTDWGDGSEVPWAEFADEIEKVIIEEGVTSIGDNAFEGCTALTEVEIPDTVIEIGDSAFEGCTALESVEIPEGVEIIGDSAFEGCESLTEIVIPETVTEIGDGAFAGCTELETVTFEGEEPPTMGEGVFEDCGSLENIYVPEDSLEDYIGSEGFGDLSDNIVPDTSGEPDNPDDPKPDNPDDPKPDNPDDPKPDNPDDPKPDNPDDPKPDNPDDPKPDDPGKANISQEVQSGENAPEAKLETPLDELIKAVLTPEEQELVENGEIEITILLTVDDGTDSVSAEDKEKAEAIMAEEALKLGQYLDVNLYKVIDGVKEEVTETNELITIAFEIPEALRGEGRTYWVIRVHNGEAFVIADQDDNADTVTIKTGKFSTYALVYSEKTTDTPPSTGGSTGGGNFTVPDLGGSGSGTTAPSETTSVDNGTPAASEDNTANVGTPAASENNTANGGTPAASENNTANGGTPTASENNTANGENTAPANSVTDNGENGTNSDESTGANGSETNPATGIAISLIPLAAITVIAAAATTKRKKK